VPQMPKAESVVVLIMSLATFGMTAAALVQLAHEPGWTAVVAAPAAVPPARPAAPAARALPGAAPELCRLDRKATPAGAPAPAERSGDGHRACKGSHSPARPT
jgi:hypothetical protein